MFVLRQQMDPEIDTDQAAIGVRLNRHIHAVDQAISLETRLEPTAFRIEEEILRDTQALVQRPFFVEILPPSSPRGNLEEDLRQSSFLPEAKRQAFMIPRVQCHHQVRVASPRGIALLVVEHQLRGDVDIGIVSEEVLERLAQSDQGNRVVVGFAHGLPVG